MEATGTGMRSEYDESRMLVCSCVCRKLVLFLTPATARCFMLFQVAFDLPIAFWTSLEGSVIEMKPTAPVPVDTQ